MRNEFPADLSARNTLGLPAAARALLRVDAATDLSAVSAQARRHGRVFVLGGGSNVVLPAMFEGLIVHPALGGVRVLRDDAGGVLLEVGAGESWHGLVSHCVARGWLGLENLALIPGTVGAAPVQNIGAYGVELSQRLHSVVAWDLDQARKVEFSVEDCGFAYRDSRYKQAPAGRWLILQVRLQLHRDANRLVLDYPDLRRHPRVAHAGTGVSARDVFEAVCEIRRAKLPDPAVLGNAGSFFKNPVVSAADHGQLLARQPELVAYAQPDGGYKLAAGWLIERAGWKGRRLGPVGMHERQALVLVNHGGATRADVQALSDAVRRDVRRQFGVALEPEPIFV